MPGFIDQVTHVNGATVAAVRKWLAANGSPLYIYTVDNAIPGDVADPINTLWNNSYSVTANDPLDTFIRVTLDIPLPALSTLDPLV